MVSCIFNFNVLNLINILSTMAVSIYVAYWNGIGDLKCVFIFVKLSGELVYFVENVDEFVLISWMFNGECAYLFPLNT